MVGVRTGDGRAGVAGSVPAVRVGVLVSGAGSILDALLQESVPVSVVLADRPCAGLAIATSAGLDAELVERHQFGREFDRDRYSKQVVDVLLAHEVNLVAMAGFGTIFSAPAHDVYGGQILNTHPALLPAFKGWHAVRDALAYGVKVTGCTVHVAGLDVDTGPILAQEAVPVLAGDTEASLHERIKAVERRLYPATLHEIIERGTVLP